jgi:hypothetical protein
MFEWTSFGWICYHGSLESLTIELDCHCGWRRSSLSESYADVRFCLGVCVCVCAILSRCVCGHRLVGFVIGVALSC